MSLKIFSKDEVYSTLHRPVFVNNIDSILCKDLNLLKYERSQYINLADLQIVKNNPLIFELLHHEQDQQKISNPFTSDQNYQTQCKNNKIELKNQARKKFINIVSSQQSQHSKLQFQNDLKHANQMVGAIYPQKNDIIQNQKTLSQNLQKIYSFKYQVSSGYFDSSPIRQQYSFRNGISQPGKQNGEQLSLQLNNLQGNNEYISHGIRNFDKKNTKRNIVFALPQLMTKKRMHSQLKGQKIIIQNPSTNQSLRYCVGCEQALLKLQINFHQQTCKQFQHIFNMTPLQIINYLRRKIHQLQDQIIKQSQELLHNDTQKSNNHSQRKLETNGSIVENEVMTSSYESKQSHIIDIRHKWQRLTDHINKANWFLKIRERIRIQFKF